MVISNKSKKYNIGDKVWSKYFGSLTKKRATITNICNNEITIKIMCLQHHNVKLIVKDFEIYPFTIDDYIDDVEITACIFNYDLNDIISYVRRIKLIKLNKYVINSNTKKVDEVLNEFDIKYI